MTKERPTYIGNYSTKIFAVPCSSRTYGTISTHIPIEIPTMHVLAVYGHLVG